MRLGVLRPRIAPVVAQDLRDALEHAEQNMEGGWLHLRNFTVSAPRRVPVAALRNYDDIVGWVDFDPGELRDASLQDRGAMLRSYRGQQWASRALAWIEQGEVPPIVIVTARGHTVIGDGRGRVNIAIGMGWPTIPAVFLTERRGAR